MKTLFKSHKLKAITIIGSIAFVIILCTVAFSRTYAKQKAESTTVIYHYDETEQRIADEVKAYLAQYLELTERASSEIADMAVKNYNIVMESDTDVISDEVTDAVSRRIKSAIVALSDHSGQLEDEALDALASGVTEIIWNAVLTKITESSISGTEEYLDEYHSLIESIQTQINHLKERKTKVSISARIIDNTDVSVDALLAGIESMSEEELAQLAEKLGISIEEIKKLLDSSLSEKEETLDEKLEDIKKELEKEIATTAGKTGATGKTGTKGAKGEKGEKGAAGKNGIDGEDGIDGKTTYIAYADDKFGANFSLTPTETSKYVGTCITSDETQPTDYAVYSNWQEYRAYIITATTDEDTGVTTVHIN